MARCGCGLRICRSPDPARAAARPLSGGDWIANYGMSCEQIARWLSGLLLNTRSCDIAAGSSLIGRHRDDLAFSVEAHDLPRLRLAW